MVLQILAAEAESSSTARVWLSREPRAISPLVAGDALSRRSWVASLVAGRGEHPVVESVGELAPAPTYDPINWPDAWSLAIVFDRRLFAGSSYLVIADPAMESADGVDAMSAAPDDRASFDGIAEVLPAVARKHHGRRRRDVENRGGVLVAGPSGDLSTHGGELAVRKRIRRRCETALAAFFHLPTYGAGLEPKKLARAPAALAARVRSQIASEEDVEGVEVRASTVAGIARIRVRAKIGGATLEEVI